MSLHVERKGLTLSIGSANDTHRRVVGISIGFHRIGDGHVIHGLDISRFSKKNGIISAFYFIFTADFITGQRILFGRTDTGDRHRHHHAQNTSA